MKQVTMTGKLAFIRQLLAIVAFVACAATAFGGRFEWNGAVSGDWNTPGNWTNNAVPGTNGTDDVWLMAAGSPPANQNIANLYVNNLCFNTNAAGYVINGNGITLKNITTYSAATPMTNAFNVPVTLAANNGWRVDNSPAMVYLVFNKAIGETGGSWPINANYNGTIILNATNNTFTGGLKNNQSVVRFASDANLGPAPTNLVSNFFEGGYGTERITNTGAWRRVTLNPNRGWHPTGQQIYLEPNLKVVINAPIYGTAFTKPSDGGSTLVLGGNSTNFTGNWQFNSGTAVLNHDMALGNGATGALITIWGTLDLNGHSQATRDVSFVNGQGDDTGGELRNNDTAHPVTLAGNANLGGGAGGNAVQFGGNGDITILGIVSNSVGAGTAPYWMRKLGNGTMTFKGANVYTNMSGVHGGGLTLDYTVQNNSKVGTNAILYLSHATLTMVGNASGATVQPVGTLSIGGEVGVNQGASSIMLKPGLNQNLTLAAGILTNIGGNMVDISIVPNGSGTAALTTTIPDAVFAGGSATWGKSTWAKVSGGTVAGMADGEYLTTFAGGTTNTHVDVPAGTNTLAGTVTEQTLRFNANAGAAIVITNGAKLTLSGINGPASLRPGILMTSNAGPVAIASSGNGGIDPGLNQTLFIHQYSTNTLTLAAAYGGAGSGNTLAKCGPGELIVTGTNNTHNGGNYAFGGTLTVDNIKDTSTNCALGTAQLVYVGNATFKYIGPAQAHNRRVLLRGPAAIDASGSGSLTFTDPTDVTIWTDAKESQLTLTGTGSGVMGGVLDLHAGSVLKDGTGTWTIGGTQPYTGNTIVTNGTLNLTNNCVLQRSLIVGPAGKLAGSVTVGEDLTLAGTRIVTLRSDSDRDTLTVGYNVTLGGAIIVTNAPGYIPPVGTLVPIVTTANGTISGTFASTNSGYIVASVGNQVMVRYAPPPPRGSVLIFR